jgi:hypothetical protein
MTRHLAIVTAVALALVGCGGSSEPPMPGTGSGGNGSGGRGGTNGAVGRGGTSGSPGRGGTTGSADSGGAAAMGGSAGGGSGGGGGGPTGGSGAAGGGAAAGGTSGTAGGGRGGGSGGRGGGSGGVGTGGGTGTAGAGGGSAGGASGNAGRGGTGGNGGAGGRGGGVSTAGTGGGPVGTGGGAAGTGGTSASSYDQTILADGPVAYWAMNKLSGSEPDLTGNNHTGTYHSGTATSATMPNGDKAADFNGSSQYLSVPSSAAFSIPTTHSLTWEAWIRPDVLQFPNDSGGYVDWMGKCQNYGPTCEWEARMYSTTNSENRCNRMSAYVFNPTAGLGSAADWQPTCGLIQAGAWYHIVGEYTTLSQPSDCQNATTYPGMIDIWVNGVRWAHSSHGQTGCMSQYNVVPAANTSPLNIGTMTMEAWFPGAIAKVAIYDKLLTSAQVTAHYRAMAGAAPTGSCGSTCSF